jgi:large subunit ribosomal protein L7/L12
MSEEVRRLASTGRKVEAIRMLREKSGIGLKEAKDLVDRLG